MRIYVALSYLLIALAALGGLCVGYAVLPMIAKDRESFCTTRIGDITLPNGVKQGYYYGPLHAHPYPPGRILVKPLMLQQLNVTVIVVSWKLRAVIEWHSYEPVTLELPSWSTLRVYSTVPVCIYVFPHRSVDTKFLSLGMALLVASIALRVGMGYVMRSTN